MFAYIARQPIVDTNKALFAYELLFRDGEDNCFPNISPDEATSRILTSSHLSLGLEEVTRGHTAFINFHKDTLLYRFPTSLDPTNVVIEVVETVDVTPQLIDACKHIRGLGYTIALDDYDLDPKWQPFLPFTSIVKFDLTTVTDEQLRDVIPRLKQERIKLVAEKVETLEQFEKYKALGFDYFQGYFFAKPEIIKHRQLSSSKITLLELMAASFTNEFDIDKINRIMERDVSLTYMLLRFINNPTMNKRNKISSLRHALNFMGEVEVKKFIALLVLANLGAEQPSEIIQMSLVRAKFCELVSIVLKAQENPPTGFLTGLLSLLDTIMHQSMDDLMGRIPISDNVKLALCGSQNLLYDCLMMVKFFEQGNWQALKNLARKYDLKQTLLHNLYNEAIKWAMVMHNSARAE